MEARAYGWYTNTILYALEGNVLRVVLEQTTGMAGSNFELAAPGIDFVPRIRESTLVFEEWWCKGCPVVMDYFASQFDREKEHGFAADKELRVAHNDYKKMCDLDSWEWRWSGRQLKKYRRASSASPIPAPSSTK
jgi:hypothetical protein